MKAYLILILSLLLLVTVGCDSEEPEETVVVATPIPPTPTPSPEDWLERGVQGWNDTESFHFDLRLTDRTITLDESGVMAFTEASGNVVAPDSMEAIALVQSPLGRTEVSYVTIGEEQWLTNPLNGEWQQAPPEFEADVAELFDAEEGLGSLLAEMENLERLEDESIDDVETVHLRGNLAGTVLSDFTSEVPETVTADLWIGADDYRLHRVVITEPTADELSPVWTFEFSDFDDVPTIEPPL